MSGPISAALGRFQAALAAAAVAALCAGCSSGADASKLNTEGDLNGQPGTQIALFHVDNTNEYQQANIDAAKARAAELGVDLTVYTSKHDAYIQSNQIRLALQRNQFDGMIMALNSGEQQCNIAKQVIEAGLPLVLLVTGTCGGIPEGTATLVNLQTPQMYRTWWDHILSTNEPQKVGVVTLPALLDLTKNAAAAMDASMKEHPGFQIVATQYTDDTTRMAYQATQDMLTANPDLKIITSISSTMTQGIAQAVKNAGKAGQVKIYDVLGNEFVTGAIAEGLVTATVPGLPRTEGRLTIDAVVSALKGEQLPEITDPSTELKIQDGPILTSTNVNQFTPEY
jgi:ribose transport system substrate-binding protein